MKSLIIINSILVVISERDIYNEGQEKGGARNTQGNGYQMRIELGLKIRVPDVDSTHCSCIGNQGCIFGLRSINTLSCLLIYRKQAMSVLHRTT